MLPYLFRRWLYAGLLVGLAACSRPAYQLAASAAYLPATPVAAPATLANAPASFYPSLTPVPTRCARRPAPGRAATARVYHLERPLRRAVPAQLPSHRAFVQSAAAGSGPYFSTDFGGLLAALFLYLLLIGLLIGLAATLLTKLIMRLIFNRPHRPGPQR